MMNKKEYLFLLLMEECGEVTQAASKCLRFTPDHTYGGYDETNLERLGTELQDLFTIVNLLEEELKVSFEKKPGKLKLKSTADYMAISKRMGTLE